MNIKHEDDQTETIPHANDNLELLPDWMTSAEFFQLIRSEKERLRQKLAADFRLRSCPQFRQYWQEVLAMEQCGLYHLNTKT